MTAQDEFLALQAEYEGKEIREAVEKAKALVESAKSQAKFESWRKALEKLVWNHHRHLPRTLIHLCNSSLTRPMEVWALSLDPADSKYWCYGSILYDRYRFAEASAPDEIQNVYGALIPREDAQAIIEVIEAVREHDLSSQVFIPKGTALLEYEPFVKLKGEEEGKWTARSVHEMRASSVGNAIYHSCYHLKNQLGIDTVREARLYMPGLNQIVNLEVHGKVLYVAEPLVHAS